MRSYLVPASEELRLLLQCLEGGVARVGVRPNHPAHPGCAGCAIESSDGLIIEIFPEQSDLEFKFEVFPIGASQGQAETGDIKWTDVDLSAPVTVSLLETEDWLDSEIPCKNAIGGSPIMQCQGDIGSAPPSADAVCRYVGGVELIGANGPSIFIATGAFPFTLHVAGIAEDRDVQRQHYRVAA